MCAIAGWWLNHQTMGGFNRCKQRTLLTLILQCSYECVGEGHRRSHGWGLNKSYIQKLSQCSVLCISFQDDMTWYRHFGCFSKQKLQETFKNMCSDVFFFRGSSNNTARKEDVCCTDPSGELRSVASGSAGRRSETCHWVPRCFSVKVMHGSRWDLDQQKYWHPISIIEIRHIYFLTFQIVIPGIKRKREREKK